MNFARPLTVPAPKTRERRPAGLPEQARLEMRELLLRTRFASKSQAFLNSGDGRHCVDQHTHLRYTQALDHIVPWVDRAVGLAGRRVIEIGSGTGSSTAAFARSAAGVTGYEIDSESVELAKERLRILEIPNALVHQVPPEATRFLIERVVEPDDIVLLYAVLEHMTIEERMATLQQAWAALGPRGVIVVVETPNRLTYLDRHTSRLPFFHMLPPELAVQYYDRSPRQDFVSQMDRSEDQTMSLVRHGGSVSYHEFEIAFGPEVHDKIVADGFEDEITSLYPIQPEDVILGDYVKALDLPIHRAFTRHPLNLIVRRGSAGRPRPLRPLAPTHTAANDSTGARSGSGKKPTISRLK